MSAPMNLVHQECLGNDVYIGHDGEDIWIYTSSDGGVQVTNLVVLDSATFRALVYYGQGLYCAARAF